MPITTPDTTLVNSQPDCATVPGDISTGCGAPDVSMGWTPECDGGGDVPIASDLTDSEDWS